MSTFPVRVMVLDAWDGFAIEVSPETRVADLKAQALSLAKVAASPDGYLVKFRGAEVPENGKTVTDAGIVANAEIIVLKRRRVPAK